MRANYLKIIDNIRSLYQLIVNGTSPVLLVRCLNYTRISVLVNHPFEFTRPQVTGFGLTYLAKYRIPYVQINQISDSPAESMAEFCVRIRAAVQSNQVERLVLDLRWNGGGNNFLLRPLLVSLIQMKNIDVRGNLIILIGPHTFSAAQNLTNRLEN
jgi:hypothetical protein